MKHTIQAVVSFPIYLSLHPKELVGKSAEEIKARLLELAAEALEQNTWEVKGYITQCSRPSFQQKIPKLSKGGFNYATSTAEELIGYANTATQDDSQAGRNDAQRVSNFYYGGD